MSMAYDIALTVIEFCKAHKIDEKFAKELLYELRQDLEFDNNYSIVEDYFRCNW